MIQKGKSGFLELSSSSCIFFYLFQHETRTISKEIETMLKTFLRCTQEYVHSGTAKRVITFNNVWNIVDRSKRVKVNGTLSFLLHSLL